MRNFGVCVCVCVSVRACLGLSLFGATMAPTDAMQSSSPSNTKIYFKHGLPISYTEVTFE